MTYPSQTDVAKIRPFFRFAAGFLFFLSVLEILLMAFVIYIEPFELMMLFGVFLGLVFGHISGCVSFTGFAPKYLLFTHGAKGDN